MKIQINNFGPIDTLEFDMNKNLHLIYGENAIGKSYATYCLYSLIKNINNKSVIRGYVFFEEIRKNLNSELLNSAFKNLKAKKRIDITTEFYSIIEGLLKNIILKNLDNSFQNTFSSLTKIRNRYSNINYSIVVDLSETEKVIFESDKNGKLDLHYNCKVKKIELLLKNTKGTKFSLYIDGKKDFGKPTEKEFADGFIRLFTFETNNILAKLDNNIDDIYYLPASRSGLYQALNAFTPIIAELTQKRFLLKERKIELPSLSEPLSEYFIDLSTIDTKHVNEKYAEIIKIIQDEILKGEVIYDEKTQRILYKPKEIDLELNLSESSSMVAELSPLVLYFKHILDHKFMSSNEDQSAYYGGFFITKRRRSAQGYDILFIEEPEAHLHPEVQIKLIEVFAKLSQLNLKIFITSHSNYMFNKINNMLIKKEIDHNDVAVYHLIRGENGATRNCDMVVTEEGINDENFIDVSEKLYMERLEALEESDD